MRSGTASPPALPAGTLRAQVAEILARDPSVRFIGFHLPGTWEAPPAPLESLQVAGLEVPVVYCPSALAFRSQLVEREGAGARAVLLTDRSAEELGADVLARLHRRKLLSLSSWEALRERVGVQIDPRLFPLRWFPDYFLGLLAAGAVQGFGESGPAVAALDAEDVWRTFLTRLGFTTPRPDLRDLLEWTADPEKVARFAELPEEAREAHAGRLAESAVPEAAAEAVLRMVSAGRGLEAMAAGLVLESLYPASPNGAPDATPEEAGRLLGRFEGSLLQGAAIDPAAARAWAEAAGEVARRRLERDGEAAVSRWLGQAGRLLDELGMAALGERGSWLASGLARRTERYAARLTEWLERRDPAGLPELAAAAEGVLRHNLAAGRPERGVLRMTLRLGRYLAARSAGAGREPGSFAAAAAAYAAEGSFVDWARAALADAPAAGALAAARDRLLAAVAAEREGENRRFAELLAPWLESGTAGGGLVPVESALDEGVAPLAAAGPVLLIVLDGLSFGVFRELAADLQRRGWEEVVPAAGPAVGRRLCGVGLLPTVTHVCRASLLTGSRRRGDAAVEREGFRQHAGLRRHGSASLPPVLFHKQRLAGEAGAGLSGEVLEKVAETGRRVVGVVLNAVDDQLPKGGQTVKRWEVPAVRGLEELLQAAAAAGRAVVLTADHGHVVERDSELRRHDGGGARYRPPGAPAGEGEVAVRGPRVLADGTGGLVAAWSERLRYSAVQSGYHGGASPQEVLVPLSVWTPFGTEVQGWEAAKPDEPAWWEASSGAGAEPVPAAPPAKPKARAKAEAAADQALLFQAPAGPSPAGPAAGSPGWLADLFASPVYQEQRGRAARQSLSDEQVRSVLAALDERGGKATVPALSQRLGLSLPRTLGHVAALQQLLNVEGFAVLSLDPDSETVVFDRELLRKQFPGAQAAGGKA